MTFSVPTISSIADTSSINLSAFVVIDAASETTSSPFIFTIPAASSTIESPTLSDPIVGACSMTFSVPTISSIADTSSINLSAFVVIDAVSETASSPSIFTIPADSSTIESSMLSDPIDCSAILISSIIVSRIFSLVVDIASIDSGVIAVAIFSEIFTAIAASSKTASPALSDPVDCSAISFSLTIVSRKSLPVIDIVSIDSGITVGIISTDLSTAIAASSITESPTLSDSVDCSAILFSLTIVPGISSPIVDIVSIDSVTTVGAASLKICTTIAALSTTTSPTLSEPIDCSSTISFSFTWVVDISSTDSGFISVTSLFAVSATTGDDDTNSVFSGNGVAVDNVVLVVVSVVEDDLSKISASSFRVVLAFSSTFEFRRFVSKIDGDDDNDDDRDNDDDNNSTPPSFGLNNEVDDIVVVGIGDGVDSSSSTCKDATGDKSSLIFFGSDNDVNAATVVFVVAGVFKASATSSHAFLAFSSIFISSNFASAIRICFSR